MCVSFTDLYNENTNISCFSQENLVKVYPNPAKKSMIFKFDNMETACLKIYSSNGQIVKNITFSNMDRIKIERESLHSGLYFYQLSNQKGLMYSGKLIFE